MDGVIDCSVEVIDGVIDCSVEVIDGVIDCSVEVIDGVIDCSVEVIDGVIDCSVGLFEDISGSPIDLLFSVDNGELVFCIELELCIEFIGSVERYSIGVEGREIDGDPEGDNDEGPVVEWSEYMEGDGD